VVQTDTDTDAYVTYFSCCLTRGIRVVPPTSTISSTSDLDISRNERGADIREKCTHLIQGRWKIRRLWGVRCIAESLGAVLKSLSPPLSSPSALLGGMTAALKDSPKSPSSLVTGARALSNRGAQPSSKSCLVTSKRTSSSESRPCS
jgi:hypothetical protein